ncbi:MAG: divalent-cation tolerance protein CutA [Minisyncoccales bacterium]
MRIGIVICRIALRSGIGIAFIYEWQGKIQKEKEFGMLVKTKAKLIDKIIKRVKDFHSYEIPCIISLPIEKGNKEFLDWIKNQTK